MTLLSFLQGRLFGRDTAHSESASADDAQPDPVGEGPPPFAGYDGLDERDVRDQLSDHSQIELEAVESHERAHQNREPVLNKLRYMRGPEPLPGYDALSAEEIVAGLKDADLGTIKKVRGYERKFANRPQVLEEAVRANHRQQASEPKTAGPGYQPLGGALASSAPVDHPDGSGRS